MCQMECHAVQGSPSPNQAGKSLFNTHENVGNLVICKYEKELEEDNNSRDRPKMDMRMTIIRLEIPRISP